MVADLWYGTSGPQDAPLVFVAESWGSEEARAKLPLVGESGKEFDRILASAGLDRRNVLCTNMIAAQPQGNETWRFFAPRDSHYARIRGLAPTPFVCDEIQRLYQQIASHPRKLVVAMGNWALWALSDHTKQSILTESNGRKIAPELQTWAPSGIISWRGSMTYVDPIPELRPPGPQLAGMSLLPIVHPAAILRAWYQRQPTVHDLRMRVPLALRGDWRPTPPPTFLAPPQFEQATSQLEHWLELATNTTLSLAIDIETNRQSMTVIGLCDSPNSAMAIPFVRPTGDGGLEPYWTIPEEARLIHLLRSLLGGPKVKIYGQNFIYDTQYIQAELGVTPICAHDTMLCQNVLYPGTPKDLSYLSSLYCHYHWYWKEEGKEWDGKGTLEDLLRYNCVDLIRTFEIAESQQQLVRHMGMEAQMDLKMKVHDLCLRMMNRGVLIDKHKRGSLAFDLNGHLASLHREILHLVPQHLVKPHEGKKTDKWWFNSAKQTSELFYDILGFKVVKKRKTGNRTAGKEALMQLEKWYPYWKPLLSRLRLAGSVDNTINFLNTPLDPDGRMRCSYSPDAETHRLRSSTNVFGRGTNLQNLTKGKEDEEDESIH